MPPWRSPIALTLERSTPRVTSVWAISGERPVMITLAPMSREASTVCTRWLATVESIVGTPVMSMTTTRARLLRIPRRSCSVSWRARQHVAQEQDDAEHLVGLDAARDDALREVTRVVLQRLHRAGLEHLDVVVVDRRRLGEDLLLRECRQQA